MKTKVKLIIEIKHKYLNSNWNDSNNKSIKNEEIVK
ncbi:hypothetical protein FF38_05602 [Lucilia cuprina]|uniref:Uncharacterized protein n=1 Tax=Lucilia cuprina TaxID=7375 RepID=A0A0L0BV44_LUCCU|nr:hypothetical protein FF38_05602 [Lucilia cuprina]